MIVACLAAPGGLCMVEMTDPLMTLFRFALVFLLAACASSCARLTLAWADLEPDQGAPEPSVLAEFEGRAPVREASEWRDERAPALRRALETHVYGQFPDASGTRVEERRVLDEAAFGGAATLEEWVLTATAQFNGVAAQTRQTYGREGFLLHVIKPAGGEGPFPVIVIETFCPWWDVLDHPAAPPPDGASSMSGSPLSGALKFVFGRYICRPPIEEIVSRGYAIAVLYPGAVVPDKKEEGGEELRRLSAGHDDDETRWGAVAAWAWLYSRAVDALETDPSIDQGAMIAWGHSRYGKAALAAGAFDERIDAVIAHQSGTGGASLNRNKPGETIAAMTDSYPHWFSPAYAGFSGREEAMPIDQHHLLSLLAPRPVLLGNARRDVWSDPAGAFRASLGADPAYALLGSSGLEQERLDAWRPSADLAFWIRPGTHGVVKEDWPAFLSFLGAHFAADVDRDKSSGRNADQGSRR